MQKPEVSVRLTYVL